MRAPINLFSKGKWAIRLRFLAQVNGRCSQKSTTSAGSATNGSTELCFGTLECQIKHKLK